MARATTSLFVARRQGLCMSRVGVFRMRADSDVIMHIPAANSNAGALLGASMFVSCVLSLLMPAMLPAAEASSIKPPNIVFLLTDDQGYADLSCHGNPILRTPNLDRLHDEGVRFLDFHVSP